MISTSNFGTIISNFITENKIILIGLFIITIIGKILIEHWEELKNLEIG